MTFQIKKVKGKDREFWKAVGYTRIVGGLKFPAMVGVYSKDYTKKQVEKSAMKDLFMADSVKVGKLKGANLKIHETIYGRIKVK